MALGDIYQLRVRTDMLGEATYNVFYYQQSTVGAGDAEDVIDTFYADVYGFIRDMTSQYATLREIQAVNGMTNADNFTKPYTVAGLYTGGTNTPAFLAFGFRSPSGGVGTRYSYKRFVGVHTATLRSDGSALMTTAFLEGWCHYTGVALGTPLEGVEGLYLPVQIGSAFQLGVTPTLNRTLVGQWAVNEAWTHQDTRQQFVWSLPDAPA